MPIHDALDTTPEKTTGHDRVLMTCAHCGGKSSAGREELKHKLIAQDMGSNLRCPNCGGGIAPPHGWEKPAPASDRTSQNQD